MTENMSDEEIEAISVKLRAWPMEDPAGADGIFVCPLTQGNLAIAASREGPSGTAVLAQAPGARVALQSCSPTPPSTIGARPVGTSTSSPSQTGALMSGTLPGLHATSPP